MVKMKLVSMNGICNLLNFILCNWWQRSWSWKSSCHDMFTLLQQLCDAPNPSTKERKWLITYYKTFGIIT
jgi:hypothetical protein